MCVFKVLTTLNISRGHKFTGLLGRQRLSEVFQANLHNYLLNLTLIAFACASRCSASANLIMSWLVFPSADLL